MPPTAARKTAPYTEPEGVDPCPPCPAAAPAIPARNIGLVWLFWPRALQCGWVCLPHEFIILGILDRTESERESEWEKERGRESAEEALR